MSESMTKDVSAQFATAAGIVLWEMVRNRIVKKK